MKKLKSLMFGLCFIFSMSLLMSPKLQMVGSSDSQCYQEGHWGWVQVGIYSVPYYFSGYYYSC